MNKINKTLHDAVYGRSPKDILGFSKDKTVHFYDLQLCTTTLCVYLSMQKGKNAVILVNDEFLFLVAFLACIYARKVPVLCGSISQKTFHLDDEAYDLIISDSDFLNPKKPFIDVRDILKFNSIREEHEIPLTNHDALNTKAPDETSKIVFYTSGSTGNQKKVEKSLKHFETESSALAFLDDAAQADDNTVLCGSVPCTHNYGLSLRVFYPLLHQIKIFFPMICFTEELSNLIGKRVCFVSSPAVISRIDTGVEAPDIVLTLSAGSVLKSSAAIRYKSWCGKGVFEIYGSTETNYIAHRINDGTDDDYTLCPMVSIREHNGEFTLFSPFMDKKLKLSDALKIQGNKVRILGRTDRVVKIDEKRISLSQIEKSAMELDFIADTHALVVNKGERESIGLIVKLSKFEDTDRRSLHLKIKNHLSKTVIPNALPRYLRIVDEIPVNEMGKRVNAQMAELFND